MIIEQEDRSKGSTNNGDGAPDRDGAESPGQDDLLGAVGGVEQGQSETAGQNPSDEIDSLREEVVNYKDKNLRLLAEMENLRKRLSREREEFHKFASEKLLTDLLPVVDSIEKAFSSSETENNEKSFSEGFHMVQKQLMDILKKHGLDPVVSLGESFDPNVHQAIQKVEKEDIDSEKVVEEFVKGYRLNGRLLRASMVCVGTPKNSK